MVFPGAFGRGTPDRRVRDAALDAKDQSRQALTRLVELEQRCERLTVVNAALWLLLKERMGLTEDDLEEKVRALDAAGGVQEALLTTPQLACPKCGRQVTARHARCMYCGSELAASGEAPKPPAPPAP